MRKSWSRRLRKGSFTVEASLLLPMLILIVFVFVCLCLYLHDRSVLASCAAEMAGKGAAQKYQTEKELEEWLAGQVKGLAEGRLLSVRSFAVSVQVTARKVTVTCEGETPLLGGLRIREAEEAKRLNPVAFIRGSKLYR